MSVSPGSRLGPYEILAPLGAGGLAAAHEKGIVHRDLKRENLFVTSDGRHGVVRAARFAPDGQTIVYGAAWGGEPLQVYLRRPDSPDALPDGVASVLTPDGKSYACSLSRNLSQLYLVEWLR